MSKFTMCGHPDAVLDSVRMAIHFFVNFDVFKSLYCCISVKTTLINTKFGKFANFGLMALFLCSYCSSVPLFLCAYCSSVPTVPLCLLFLCAYCSSVPTVPLCLLFLCSSIPLFLLFLCAYCSSVPTVPLCLLFLCAYCSYVPTVPVCLLFLFFSVVNVVDDVTQVVVHEPWAEFWCALSYYVDQYWVAYPIIYRFVPCPSRFEIMQYDRFSTGFVLKQRQRVTWHWFIKLPAIHVPSVFGNG